MVSGGAAKRRAKEFLSGESRVAKMGDVTRVRMTSEGSRATVTISTDGGINVLSATALKELGGVVNALAGDSRIRFTVFRAEGKVFVAGADIKEMSGFDAQAARSYGELGSRVLDAIEALPSVTVAALQGAALGGGCELAMACDFRIATSQVKIGMPETTLGLVPGWGGIPRALRLLGEPAAKRLIFSGVPVTADEALALGLVDEVVSDAASLNEAVGRWFQRFSRGGPMAISGVKRALRDGQPLSAFADCFARAESREGMAAFAEKRNPNWAAG